MFRAPGSALRTASLLSAVLFFAGCNKANQPAAPKVHVPPAPPTGVDASVSGRVSYHGVGLASGVVQIFGEKGDPVVGMIQMGGTYTVWNPPTGPCKVTVSTSPPSYVSNAPPAPGAGNKLPSRYADPDTSGLTVKVTGGRQRYDIELTD